MKMDLAYIPALAAVSGSASGALATVLTGWMTQRRKDRVRLTSRATSQREKLYKAFIEEASRLYADALVNDKFEIPKLVDLYALIGRISACAAPSTSGEMINFYINAVRVAPGFRRATETMHANLGA